MSLKPATLNKKEFGSFLKQVMQTYDVIAPVELAEGVSAYRKIESPEEASLAFPQHAEVSQRSFLSSIGSHVPI